MTRAHLIPVPPGVPPRQHPAEALTALARRIPEPGTRFYLCADRLLGVPSLPAVSVWSNGRVLWWRTAAGEMVWPAVDTPGAARRLAELLTSAHPPG